MDNTIFHITGICTRLFSALLLYFLYYPRMYCLHFINFFFLRRTAIYPHFVSLPWQSGLPLHKFRAYENRIRIFGRIWLWVCKKCVDGIHWISVVFSLIFFLISFQIQKIWRSIEFYFLLCPLRSTLFSHGSSALNRDPETTERSAFFNMTWISVFFSPCKTRRHPTHRYY